MEEKTYLLEDTFVGDKVGNKHAGHTVDDIKFVLKQFALEEKEKTEKVLGYKGKTGLAIIVGDDKEDDLAIIFGNGFKDIVDDLSAQVRDYKSVQDLFMTVFINCAMNGYIDVEMLEMPAAEKPASKQTIS